MLYPELTLREHLEMTIMAYDLDATVAWQDADNMLKMFRLDNKLDWFPAKFSKGMQQKGHDCGGVYDACTAFYHRRTFYWT